MIVILERGTTPEQTAKVLAELEALGLGARAVHGARRPLVHVFDGPTRLARRVLWMERVVGLVPTSGPRVRREGRRFYPYHFVNWSAVALLMMGILVSLAGFFPPGLGAPPDPQSPPAELAQPWYLLILDGLRGGSPLLGWLVFAAVVLVLFLLPVLDRSQGTRIRDRWLFLTAGGLGLFGVLYLVLRNLS